MRYFAIAGLMLYAVGASHGQPTMAPRFEVASIKPSKADSSFSSGIKTGHGRVDAGNVTLKRCIIGAYGLGPNQISGGPDWIDSDRFDISAKADGPVDGDAELMMMLRALLSERFKLILHSETRTVPAYVLEVAKNGPKLEKGAPGESRTNTTTNNAGVILDAYNLNMDSFARILARSMDLPVVNHTGLEGIYNLKLQWTPEKARQAGGVPGEGPSIFTAIQEQLGLRLRAAKTPVESLVIDHAERPTEN